LIWSEALLAFVCLCEVQLGDPGEIKRTKNTCLPVPEEIARVLRGEAPPLLGNLDGVDGRVYCVRCHLWRPDDVDVHHCRMCQRCVVHFDHHCGVLGRCIAGKGMKGNYKYFITLIACGHLGFLTFAAASAATLFRRWGWEALLIGICVAVVVLCCGVSLCMLAIERLVFKGILGPWLQRRARGRAAEQPGQGALGNAASGGKGASQRSASA